MRPHPKEILEAMNAIAELFDRQFPHLTPPDVVYVLEMLKSEHIAVARKKFGFDNK